LGDCLDELRGKHNGPCLCHLREYRHQKSEPEKGLAFTVLVMVNHQIEEPFFLLLMATGVTICLYFYVMLKPKIKQGWDALIRLLKGLGREK
jgi:hypothetical protein